MSDDYGREPKHSGKEKNILPDYPRTRHLPHKPNASSGDSVASTDEAAVIFTNEDTTVEEKIDGSGGVGMCYYEGNPIIRNRNHLLNKAFTQRRTAAKMQFASIFNWFYENAWKFEAANERLGFPAAVYGEWMYAVHGIKYENLPSLFIAYDIYDWQENKFLPSSKAREILALSGFDLPPLLHHGKVEDYEQLECFCKQKSLWSNELMEGVYVKVNGVDRMESRFKMVRSGFVQGAKWSDSQIVRNAVSK